MQSHGLERARKMRARERLLVGGPHASVASPAADWRAQSDHCSGPQPSESAFEAHGVCEHRNADGISASSMQI